MLRWKIELPIKSVFHAVWHSGANCKDYKDASNIFLFCINATLLPPAVMKQKARSVIPGKLTDTLHAAISLTQKATPFLSAYTSVAIFICKPCVSHVYLFFSYIIDSDFLGGDCLGAIVSGAIVRILILLEQRECKPKNSIGVT